MDVKRKRVEVLATDGEEIRRLMWIEQAKDGSFYWGLVIPRSDVHSSYHPSGEFHFSLYHKPSQRQKLANFKGITKLAGLAVIKNLKKITHKPFEPRKLDGVVYIDFRAMEQDTINIDLLLIEQGHPEQRFVDKAYESLKPSAQALMLTLRNTRNRVLFYNILPPEG